MPEMAKKVGKLMADFRGTANEFKETWHREVNLENASRHFDLNNIEAQVDAEQMVSQSPVPAVAEIKEVDPAMLGQLKTPSKEQAESLANPVARVNDKKNWL
jgi:Sec-independent protein translocase protein TatA